MYEQQKKRFSVEVGQTFLKVNDKNFVKVTRTEEVKGTTYFREVFLQVPPLKGNAFL